MIKKNLNNFILLVTSYNSKFSFIRKIETITYNCAQMLLWRNTFNKNWVLKKEKNLHKRTRAQLARFFKFIKKITCRPIDNNNNEGSWLSVIRL